MKKILTTLLLILLVGLAPLPAEVIYTPTAFSYSVGTSPLPYATIFTADLPGANDLVMGSFSYVGAVPSSNFYQLYFLNNGGYIAADIRENLYYAHSLNLSETWDNTSNGWQWGADLSRMAQTGNSSFGLRSDPTYVPFWFYDTSHSNQVDYGYIALTTTVTDSGDSAQLNLDISGFAYENSGAKIRMGAVPEPSSLFFAALGLGIMGIVAVLRRHTTRVCS